MVEQIRRFWWQYVFRPDYRTVKLSAAYLVVSGVSCVFCIASGIDPIDAKERGTIALNKSDNSKLLAFITCISIGYAGWIQWLFSRSLNKISEELKGRPCWYKVHEEDMRRRGGK